MADKSFLSSLYTYPWDLTDEGLDRSLDRIAARVRCSEVMITPSYHVATYFLPHNPRRTIYYGDDGAVYFHPQNERYANTAIRPRVSDVVSRPDYFERIAEGVHKRGLKLGAWIVYFFNHYLARTYPQFAKVDALGNHYLGQLSATPRDVHEYVVALTSEIVERFKPAAVHVESLSRLPWTYGFRNAKVLTPISPRCEFLLGVCFNPASVANANAEGMDAERFKQRVAQWLRPRLARLPTDEDAEFATEDWIGSAFEGELQRYLDACRKNTTNLWLRVAEVIHRGGAKVQSGLASARSLPQSDLDPSSNRQLDRVTTGPLTGDDRGRRNVREIREQIADGGIVLASLQPGGFVKAAPLVEQVHAAAASGAGGCTFYNYGLLREQQLDFIGQALDSL